MESNFGDGDALYEDVKEAPFGEFTAKNVSDLFRMLGIALPFIPGTGMVANALAEAVVVGLADKVEAETEARAREKFKEWQEEADAEVSDMYWNAKAIESQNEIDLAELNSGIERLQTEMDELNEQKAKLSGSLGSVLDVLEKDGRFRSGSSASDEQGSESVRLINMGIKGTGGHVSKWGTPIWRQERAARDQARIAEIRRNRDVVPGRLDAYRESLRPPNVPSNQRVVNESGGTNVVEAGGSIDEGIARLEAATRRVQENLPYVRQTTGYRRNRDTFEADQQLPLDLPGPPVGSEGWFTNLYARFGRGPVNAAYDRYLRSRGYTSRYPDSTQRPRTNGPRTPEEADQSWTSYARRLVEDYGGPLVAGAGALASVFDETNPYMVILRDMLRSREAPAEPPVALQDALAVNETVPEIDVPPSSGPEEYNIFSSSTPVRPMSDVTDTWNDVRSAYPKAPYQMPSFAGGVPVGGIPGCCFSPIIVNNLGDGRRRRRRKVRKSAKKARSQTSQGRVFGRYGRGTALNKRPKRARKVRAFTGTTIRT